MTISRQLTAAMLAAGAVAGGCRPPWQGVSTLGELNHVPQKANVAAVAAHVRALADPSRGGRMTATPGNLFAQEYIVEQFKAVGLVPGGVGGGWFLPFDAPALRWPGPRSALAVDGGRARRLYEDFAPMATGSSGAFAGQVVFVGYGYRNALLGRDDYAGQDVRGKVVMLFRGTDLGVAPGSLWQSKGPALREALLVSKLKTAASLGAAGALVVTPPQACEVDPLASVIGKGDGPLPAMRISRRLAGDLLKAGGQVRTLADLAASPESMSLAASLAGRCDLARASARNIVGELPGTDADAPTVVLGAHYDHLPASGQHAKDRGIGVRPGADDNASGVAVLIEAARAAAAIADRKCRIIFVAFDHEEFGFRGSKHFVDHCPVPLHRVAAMVNFDQLGAMKDGRVRIIGNVIREPFAGAIAAAGRRHPGLTVQRVPVVNRRGWSDQAAFAKRGVPTLFFFTRFTRHYHRMTDTAETVNLAGAAQAAALAVDLVRILDACYAP